MAGLRTGEILGRITVDSDAVEILLLRSFVPILAAIAALLGAAAMFALLSIALAIVAVAGLVLAGGVLVGLAYHEPGQPARRFVTAPADARHTLIETLDGLPELRSFGAEQHAAASAIRQLELFGQSRRQLTRLAARGQSVSTFLADLTLLAVILTAAGLIGTRHLAAPAFVAVCLVAIAVVEPVIGLPGAITARARARAEWARLTELFPSSATTITAATTRALQTLPRTARIKHETGTSDSRVIGLELPRRLMARRQQGASGVGRSAGWAAGEGDLCGIFEPVDGRAEDGRHCARRGETSTPRRSGQLVSCSQLNCHDPSVSRLESPLEGAYQSIDLAFAPSVHQAVFRSAQ